MLATIAWRNLWRNKLRSSVIITAIAVGITGGIVTDGLMRGMTNQRTDAAIANEISNLWIQNPRFLLNNEIKYLLPSGVPFIKTIQSYPEVRGMSARLDCEAMAASASAGAGVTAYGVDFSSEKKVSDIYKHLKEGSWPDNKTRFSAVIGKKLADKLDLGLDDRLILTLADTTGTITSGAFQIKGIYKTSNDLFDGATIFVNKKDLASILGFAPDAAHQIAVRLKDNGSTDAVVERIKHDFAREIESEAIIVRSWHEISPLLKSMVEMMDMFSFIFMIIILVALAFAIVNTMVMAIMERTREIGMLMALGLNKKKVFGLIMLETLFLSLAGAVTGLIVSLIIVHHYAVSGLDISSVSRGMNSIGYSAVIYFSVSPEFYAQTILLVVLLAFVAAISPARKALKLQPASALRDSN